MNLVILLAGVTFGGSVSARSTIFTVLNTPPQDLESSSGVNTDRKDLLQCV